MLKIFSWTIRAPWLSTSDPSEAFVYFGLLLVYIPFEAHVTRKHWDVCDTLEVNPFNNKVNSLFLLRKDAESVLMFGTGARGWWDLGAYCSCGELSDFYCTSLLHEIPENRKKTNYNFYWRVLNGQKLSTYWCIFVYPFLNASNGMGQCTNDIGVKQSNEFLKHMSDTIHKNLGSIVVSTIKVEVISRIWMNQWINSHKTMR